MLYRHLAITTLIIFSTLSLVSARYNLISLQFDLEKQQVLIQKLEVEFGRLQMEKMKNESHTHLAEFAKTELKLTPPPEVMSLSMTMRLPS